MTEPEPDPEREEWAAEIMAKRRPVKVYRHVESRGPHNIYAVDLADMISTKDAKENEGHRYILCVVDVFTRYAWCYPLKGKTAAEAWRAIEPLCTDAATRPGFIWADKGGEFYGKGFAGNLKRLGIGIYSTYSPYKVSIAERFIQTLKKTIWLNNFTGGHHKWLEFLKDMVNAYNHRKHSTIKMSPADAMKPENHEKVVGARKPVPASKATFAVGDWVRKSRILGVFEKAHYSTFSAAVFQITRISSLSPPMYHLKDFFGKEVKGAFYAEQLRKAKNPFYMPYSVEGYRGEGDDQEVFVRYFGYPPRWRPLSEVNVENADKAKQIVVANKGGPLGVA